MLTRRLWAAGANLSLQHSCALQAFLQAPTCSMSPRDRRVVESAGGRERDVVGIDASEEYLEGARQHRSHRNITYECRDIRQMRFTDNAFDAAVSTSHSMCFLRSSR